jgi:hypothetical protein
LGGGGYYGYHGGHKSRHSERIVVGAGHDHSCSSVRELRPTRDVKTKMVDPVLAEIKGTTRVIAGEDATFLGVRYRISVVELQGRRSLLQGTLETEPSVLSALTKLGEAAIDLGDLGWFGFYVTDEHRGTIRLIGPINTD